MAKINSKMYKSYFILKITTWKLQLKVTLTPCALSLSVLNVCVCPWTATILYLRAVFQSKCRSLLITFKCPGIEQTLINVRSDPNTLNTYVLQKGFTSPTASYTLLQLCSVLNETKNKTLFVSIPEEEEQPFFVWILATAIVSILLFSVKSQTTSLFIIYIRGYFFHTCIFWQCGSLMHSWNWFTITFFKLYEWFAFSLRLTSCSACAAQC